jgi:hypothetical protein
MFCRRRSVQDFRDVLARCSYIVHGLLPCLVVVVGDAFMRRSYGRRRQSALYPIAHFEFFCSKSVRVYHRDRGARGSGPFPVGNRRCGRIYRSKPLHAPFSRSSRHFAGTIPKIANLDADVVLRAKESPGAVMTAACSWPSARMLSPIMSRFTSLSLNHFMSLSASLIEPLPRLGSPRVIVQYLNMATSISGRYNGSAAIANVEERSEQQERYASPVDSLRGY